MTGKLVKLVTSRDLELSYIGSSLKYPIPKGTPVEILDEGFVLEHGAAMRLTNTHDATHRFLWVPREAVQLRSQSSPSSVDEPAPPAPNSTERGPDPSP